MRCSGPFAYWFATGSSRSDPVETDLQKLISEYCAIEKMVESFSRRTEQIELS
jgi:hypothetical protein